ncbi:DUF262 domain-containing protein [Pseudomonas aeruginosa]
MPTDEQSRRQLVAATDRLSKIIRPIEKPVSNQPINWSRLGRYLESQRDLGDIDFCPEYQRGHVWTPEQQLRYVESVLRGTVSTAGLTLQFNCPNFIHEGQHSKCLPRGIQCMDGLQRYTTAMRFLNGEIKPFGLSIDDLSGSMYAVHLHFEFHIEMFSYQKLSDVLYHYAGINGAGTQHSPEELERVNTLLTQARKAEGVE